jgi:type IV secretory pathway TrbD component
VPAFDLLEKLSVALPVASIVLIVLGVALSARRGRTLMVAGFGLVLVTVLVILFQWLVRSQVTAKSPSPELAGPFYDALTSKVSIVLWVVCGIGGVFVIVGAFLARRAPAADPRPAADYGDQRSYRR